MDQKSVETSIEGIGGSCWPDCEERGRGGDCAWVD